MNKNEWIEEGDKVRILSEDKSGYKNTDESNKPYFGMVGTVVSIDSDYQAPDIYTVVFENESAFISVFEYYAELVSKGEMNKL